MKAHAACLLALYGLSLSVRADEQVRATQEELRRRRVYFGDVDGRRTPELESAMKRYQKRKGFTASGREDRDTMRSLGLAAREPGEAPPKELSWPEEPVLKSDTTIDIGAAAEQIADETGVAAASIAPAAVAVKTSGGKQATAAIAPKSRRPRADAVAATSGAPTERKLMRADQRLDPRELRAFVQDYLKAVERNDPRAELGFYADDVDYYHNGQVDRRIVERTLRDYYQRWPKRRCSLGEVEYGREPKRGVIVVKFRVNFTLKNGDHRIKGSTENSVTINAATADPRIVKIEERRIRG